MPSRVRPVSGLISLTAARATAAPEESVTVPATPPRNVCATRETAARVAASNTAESFVRDKIGLLNPCRCRDYARGDTAQRQSSKWRRGRCGHRRNWASKTKIPLISVEDTKLEWSRQEKNASVCRALPEPHGSKPCKI